MAWRPTKDVTVVSVKPEEDGKFPAVVQSEDLSFQETVQMPIAPEVGQPVTIVLIGDRWSPVLTG